MADSKMFQVSTLSALALGYTRKVITIEELLKNGDTGLGTFENVDGEMIVVNGHCYRASDDGSISQPSLDTGVPFASVAFLQNSTHFDFENISSIEELKQKLNQKIEEDFGLNSMHIVRIDALCNIVKARSEGAFKSHHVELKEILAKRQKDFEFSNVQGTFVCIYYPDYMQGINAAGWHFHFVSDDRTQGGHVFEMSFAKGKATLCKISKIELQLPTEAAFDTYSLATDMSKDIKKVEQGE